ncbi:carboxymuconolactone decarboxylase family protein [Nocardiopsis chromatogenes]|uniref:carboxymuconolactone decarboxylase family protein n=1 Tax=Nocardiopsis chromatogenes TaxID=280239 RepID=UPI000364693E|nr:carboxymuconolactone decarboxylase family protein [Nocardiopsis chromatogenes]
MPRIPVHTVDDAPEAARDGLKALQAKMGKVLNIHGEMAHAPVVLAAYQGIQAAIAEHGTFDARVREAIALAVGAANDCAYCQSAHTLSARAAGWTEEELGELFTHVLVNMYTNFFNHYTHTELDVPAAPGLG